MDTGKRVVFLVTEDWYFYSHRMPIARGLIRSGCEVVLLTRVNQHKDRIEQEGINVIPLGLKRESKHIVWEIKAVIEIALLYRKLKPHLVHHVAVKPILYGSIAAILTGVPKVVNAFAGLGFIFSEKKRRISRLIRWGFIQAYRSVFISKKIHAIFQNPEDKALFEQLKIVNKKQSTLIRGSGVDPDQYRCIKEPKGTVTILFGARMLWDNGVGELIRAARILKKEGLIFQVILAGVPDPSNPNSVDTQTLRKWHDQGIAEWVGFQTDMAKLFSQVHIVTLPSYREGVSKFLIEAASCGRPIVTTDTPGCREIVLDNKNGFLVPVKDAEALAGALSRLIRDPGLRKKMGSCGRAMVLKSFSDKIVVEKTMAFYRQVWN
ncbi:MAG: glycosyltransferase family 4 protein [Desulfobacterales bacterium]|nr:glycosyltransferase family 4 protein [Desulfobacterales bacterium]